MGGGQWTRVTLHVTIGDAWEQRAHGLEKMRNQSVCEMLCAHSKPTLSLDFAFSRRYIAAADTKKSMIV